MSDNNVHWIIEVDIHDGQKETFTALMSEMIIATKADEPDALNYEWHISGDGNQCHIYERYIDSAATITHLNNFGTKFAERFIATATPTKLTVYGDPSTEARTALAGLGAVHMEQIGGFTR